MGEFRVAAQGFEMIYAFGDFELDTDRFELRHRDQARKVEPKVFSLLELLLANASRVVTKGEINQAVWGGRVVSEAAVSSAVKAARQAIGDDGKAQAFIRTVHGRGFRFVAEVDAHDTAFAEPAVPAAAAALSIVPEAPGGLAGDADPANRESRPSIAVLPLQVTTPDERFGGLGDAISHEVIVELSRLHWLFVIARGSSFRFREPAVDFGQVGRVLGARYVLTGTIAFLGTTSIVTVELTNTTDGKLVWADRFDCPVDELLQLRTTIAGHIVTAIETRIQMAEAAHAARLPTESLDAWSAYHRGLWHVYRFNKHDNEIASRMFDRALSADPNFARAHAGLSFTHMQNVLVGYTDDVEHQRDQTRRFAERSLELDPMDPFVNLTMGRSAWIGGDFAGAMPWLDRSIDLSPNYAFAHYNRGLLDALLGAGERSEEGVAKALALSPIDPLNYAMLATRALSHFVRGDFETAADWGAQSVRAPNAHVHIHVIAAIVLGLAGREDEAAARVAHVRREARDFSFPDFERSFRFKDDTTLELARRTWSALADS